MSVWARRWRALYGRSGAEEDACARMEVESPVRVHRRVRVRALQHAVKRLWKHLCEQGRERMRRAELARELQALNCMQARNRAKQKSLSLLLDLLDCQQRSQFQLCGYFHVIGGATGNHYRIRAEEIANIDLLGRDGTIRHRLCAQPKGNIPLYDVLAGQLLYLQDPDCESRFLAQAKSHPALPY